jgi:hypothetical protein
VDPSRLQLFADGLQVPILLNVRQQGVFASGDGIEFYGEGLDTPATAVRVYWLVVGSGEGLRIREAVGGGGGTPGPASFPYEVERADRTVYVPAVAYVYVALASEVERSKIPSPLKSQS